MMTPCRFRLYRQCFGGPYWPHTKEKNEYPVVLADVYSTAAWQHSCHKKALWWQKTNKLIVATELRIVRMTNVFSAQHIQRKIWGSDGGVDGDPFTVGIFCVTGVKLLPTFRTVLLPSSAGSKDFVLTLHIRRCFKMLVTICLVTQCDSPQDFGLVTQCDSPQDFGLVTQCDSPQDFGLQQ
jgi:hypothetical protein